MIRNTYLATAILLIPLASSVASAAQATIQGGKS